MIDVFQAVQKSTVLYGVVPIENSINGAVLDTLDLLIDREKDTADVLVCGEAYLPIHHCLLGHAGANSLNGEAPPVEGTTSTAARTSHSNLRHARPSADLSRIERVLSHHQAFGQCDTFLSAYLKSAEHQEVSSTSKAAELVAADPSGTSAAISSSLAAGIYGLDVLADGIQDREDNTTRFFILQKGPTSPGDSSVLGQRNGTEALRWKTLVAFRINHHSSGALANALETFKTFQLNLTSINSRPSRILPWHYVFLVEFEEKRHLDGSGRVNQALEELSRTTSGWRWLGSWINRMES